jgi:hypothetical protein
VTSLNWSGYAVVPPSGGVTAVQSTMTVPSASLLPPGFAATWTGIGGYSTGDLIQAGVGEQSFPSNPLFGDQYFPWYELLPGAEIQLTGCMGDATCAVAPGDVVHVNIFEIAAGQWTIQMTDNGHWMWSKNVSYASTHSSAEWILEAPSVDGLPTLLAGTGNSLFTGSTYTANGSTNVVAQGDPVQIDLSPLPIALLNEAAPSALSADGTSFNDCAYALAGCPAP